MPDTQEIPKIDISKMNPQQLANYQAELEKLKPVESREARAAREEQERNVRVEQERQHQVSRAFVLAHADDFQPGEYNAKALAAELEGQSWTREGLEAAFTKLSREGKLLPPPYKEPAPPVELPFDYKGLTLAALKAMPRNEYKAKLENPVYRRIIEKIVEDHNQGKA